MASGHGLLLRHLPGRLDDRSLLERLHHDAVLLGLLLEAGQLLGSSLGRVDLEAGADRLEADRHVTSDAKSTPQVEITFEKPLFMNSNRNISANARPE